MILKVSFSNRSDNYDIVTLVDEQYYISDSDNCTEVEAIEDFINYSKVDTSVLAIASNVLTVLSTTGFVKERPIIFTGAVYGDIVANRTYYVKDILSATTFTISSAIEIGLT